MIDEIGGIYEILVQRSVSLPNQQDESHPSLSEHVATRAGWSSLC
jgi:hypothetical protein